MKMMKRAITLALSLVIVCLSLVACTPSTPAATTPAATTPAATTQPGASTTSTSPATTAISAPLEINMTVRLFDQVPDMNNGYWKEYQKRTNTKLSVEWIPDGDYTTKLNLILASNAIPEVLIANCSNNLNNPSFINAAQNGAFWDLTGKLGDFSKYPNLKSNVSPGSWDTSRVLGKIYGVPQSVPQVSGGPIIREDLVNEAGQKMPTTMTGLLDVLAAIKAKNPNMVGLVSKQDMFINSNGGFASAFGSDTPVYNAEGGLVYSKLTPAFTKFVRWLKDAYGRGLLSKEFSVMKPTQATELFQSGAAALMVNESARWCFPFTTTLQKVKAGAIAQFIPPLEGDTGKFSVGKGTGVVDSMFISGKVPEAKMLQILAYFEKTTTTEYYDLTTYGVEGVHYNVVGGYKVATDQRNLDMGSSAPWQVLPLAYNPYMKIDSTAAPEKYNIDQRDLFTKLGYGEKGVLDPFSVATSQTWISVWPKFMQEWATKGVQAVIGTISVEEYQLYVDKINGDTEVKKAYKEFADSYKAIFK